MMAGAGRRHDAIVVNLLAASARRPVLASPDRQILTDPDCRSMETSGRGSGMSPTTCKVSGSAMLRNKL
jgi:hypothetical protein